MKKSIILVLLVTHSMIAWSQDNIFPNSGNVGIGSPNPSFLLEIANQSGTSAVDLCNGGIAHSISDYSDIYNAQKAFNNNDQDAWSTMKDSESPFDAWLAYEFSSATVINRLRLRSRPNYEHLVFNDFSIEGSNNSTNGFDGTWITLATSLQTTSENKWYEFSFSNNNSFKWYRLYGPAQLHTGNTYYIHVGEIEMMFDTTESNPNILIVKNNGQIGIGTSVVPTDYKLSIMGKAIMEEVKVQLSENWPDYVFESDYKLKSLEEVEAHIKANGHLPEIPSEAEVATEDGISLGEMNIKLLQKVEELTLYLIEEHKSNEELKREVADLKEEVLKLKEEKNAE